MLRSAFAAAAAGLLCGSGASPAAAATAAAKPHIIMILADDYGHANFGKHASPEQAKEVVTPTLDALADEGVLLERHYTFKICSPSRTSLQSGRLPVHVNTLNTPPESVNPEDPVSGFAGMPVNMTGVAQKLKSAGYATHMTGKWDVGLATPTHTPRGRGYDTFLGYYHHANDYYNEGLPYEATGHVNVCDNKFTDLWLNDGPALGMNGTGAYEEDIFRNHTLATIAAHARLVAGGADTPLFLFHSFHIVHTPLQVPKDYLDQFDFIKDEGRRTYAAMVKYMDDVVSDIVAALKAGELWDDTLLVFSADNGGPLYVTANANNFPLRGGKYSDFEGGVRTNAFVSGGFLPPAVRGTTQEALVHVADWYATFCEAAGVDPTDAVAAAAGLPPVDSISALHLLGLGNNASAPARQEIHLSNQSILEADGWKIVVGMQQQTGWTGPLYPNITGAQPLPPMIKVGPHWEHDCGAGCLFHVFDDETEHHDLAAEAATNTTVAAKLQQLQARLAELNQGNFNPNRGQEDPRACTAAEGYGGYYGPFVDV